MTPEENAELDRVARQIKAHLQRLAAAGDTRFKDPHVWHRHNAGVCVMYRTIDVVRVAQDIGSPKTYLRWLDDGRAGTFEDMEYDIGIVNANSGRWQPEPRSAASRPPASTPNPARVGGPREEP